MKFNISNNSSLCQKHLGVPDGSDGADGTWYPLMEKYIQPVTQAMSDVAYIPALPCIQSVVTNTHHRKVMCITLFPGAAGIL